MIRKTLMTLATGTLLVLGTTTLSTAAHAAELMTKEKMLNYYKLFNAEDLHYAELLAPNVEFDHFVAGKLRGPQQIIDFYKKLWTGGMQEVREPTAIVIDNEGGQMAIEMLIHITARPGRGDVKLPTGEVIKQGEEWQGASVLFYGIHDGKITSIRGATSGPGKITRVVKD
ncbi:nuclear transport factor 2 family protein [Burkholderia sp. MR1-5-21]